MIAFVVLVAPTSSRPPSKSAGGVTNTRFADVTPDAEHDTDVVANPSIAPVVTVHVPNRYLAIALPLVPMVSDVGTATVPATVVVTPVWPIKIAFAVVVPMLSCPAAAV